MKYLANSFSLQMLNEEEATVQFETVKPEEIPNDTISAIGHPDTSSVLSGLLDREIPMNRISVSLMTGDELYVAQLVGGRLPEGSTTLPKGFTFRFYKVIIVPKTQYIVTICWSDGWQFGADSEIFTTLDEALSYGNNYSQEVTLRPSTQEELLLVPNILYRGGSSMYGIEVKQI